MCAVRVVDWQEGLRGRKSGECDCGCVGTGARATCDFAAARPRRRTMLGEGPGPTLPNRHRLKKGTEMGLRADTSASEACSAMVDWRDRRCACARPRSRGLDGVAH